MSSKVLNNESASIGERGFALFCVAGMTAGAAVVGYFDPTTAGFFPVCPLYKMTGLACPGCGTTRALHALLHGDIVTALDYNLLVPFILIFFAYLFVSLFLTFVRGRGLNFKPFNSKIVWSFFIFAVAFTILRNLPYYPFNILYP
ncbi:MAG TPA: DUF2752 domain-containing protein [Pyrinomonadaceae bacterium]|jgi:hypothetical protein